MDFEETICERHCAVKMKITFTTHTAYGFPITVQYSKGKKWSAQSVTVAECTSNYLMDGARIERRALAGVK